MEALKKVECHYDVVEYFKELPFYNKHTEKPKIKCLKSIDLLSALLSYEKLNAIKRNHAFRTYEMKCLFQFKNKSCDES